MDCGEKSGSPMPWGFPKNTECWYGQFALKTNRLLEFDDNWNRPGKQDAKTAAIAVRIDRKANRRLDARRAEKLHMVDPRVSFFGGWKSAQSVRHAVPEDSSRFGVAMCAESAHGAPTYTIE